ncbi:site-specific integrase [Lacimicrobium alkaliphilum]|uniref:Recombinase n=1 Tax=Lacimicrobium alkaliphilum TaxID=1526571 RepID=A0ABQ1R8T6_9ALTE|nr:site-specific integrase [Lacimicrobium alkaliphilum]GGD61579.1 recombinase [Lacimicrobium alkaliphilum]
MSKLTHLLFQSGERYPALIDDDGIPDFWVTLYVTVQLRTSHTANAIENIIRNIMHFKLWEEVEQRDIIWELINGQLPDNDDVYSLRDHCLVQTKSVRRMHRLKSDGNVARLEQLFPAGRKTLPRVSKTHYAIRLTHIADFLKFTARCVMRRRSDYAQKCQEIDRFIELIKAQRKKVSKHKSRANFEAPPIEIFESFMEFVNEKNPDNPFKNPGIRFRNSLIFELLYATGCRSGELLGLRIDDIDFINNRISIVRRHDTVDDWRARQPVAKTLERSIFIENNLLRRLRSYILDVRSKIPFATKHPYIFVTHKKGKYQGHPISNSNFKDRILRAATMKRPELYQGITRHGFRHNFNYKISVRTDANNEAVARNKEQAIAEGRSLITESQEIKSRMELNGWASENSAHIYNRRHIREKADLLMRSDMELQSNLTPKGIDNESE